MQLGVVVHANNPQYLVAEAEGLQIWGQFGLHAKTLSQKWKKKENKQT
jgi:hypothetical protein